MRIAFYNQNDLYHRLYPALRTKKREFKKMKISTITEDDIWKFLINKKWKESSDLSLSIMVDDILKLDSVEILEYVIKEDDQII